MDEQDDAGGVNADRRGALPSRFDDLFGAPADDDGAIDRLIFQRAEQSSELPEGRPPSAASRATTLAPPPPDGGAIVHDTGEVRRALRRPRRGPLPALGFVALAALAILFIRSVSSETPPDASWVERARAKLDRSISSCPPAESSWVHERRHRDSVPEIDQHATVDTPETTKERAQRALEAGDARQGLRLSRDAVRVAHDDADAYLLWGAALIELGREHEARRAFSRCTRVAVRGNVDECRALAARSWN